MSKLISKTISHWLIYPCLVLLFIGIVGCFLIKFCIVLEPATTRQQNSNIEMLKNRIAKETIGMTTNQIVDYAENLTCEQLEFGWNCNCKHYSSMCTKICNYAFQINNLPAKAIQYVGTVKLFGWDLCRTASEIFESCNNHRIANFVRNHDFVGIKENKKTTYFSPDFPDLIGISIRNK